MEIRLISVASFRVVSSTEAKTSQSNNQSERIDASHFILPLFTATYSKSRLVQTITFNNFLNKKKQIVDIEQKFQTSGK